MTNYTKEEEGFSPITICEEAARCLLCHDAPCSAACPAKTDPAKFIRSVRFRNFKGAVETIRENNPLGGICARVCPAEKYCEGACSRTGIDKPIEIAKIQRYITDFEEFTQMEILKKSDKKINKSIGIIGSGPAGLSLASFLLQKGYKVEIYEKEEHLGGYLRYGIPEYRLPNDVVDNEIKKIIKLGLTIHKKTEVGINISEEELKNKHDAIIYAIGLSKGKVLPMFENNTYVDTAVELLKKIKRNKGNIKAPKKVLVIGGGSVSMDIATSLKKVGTENVIVVAYEELKEFKATKKERIEALENNVSIYDGYVPTKVKSNIVTFRHRIIDSEITIEADKIVLAIGQEILKNKLKVKTTHNIIGDKKYTVEKNVYAVGDITEKSDGTVVDAIRNAKELAEIINNNLGGK